MKWNSVISTAIIIPLTAVCTLAGQIACATDLPPSKATVDVTPQFSDYRPYQELAQDSVLAKQFHAYMEQLYNLKVPDAVMVFGMMKDNMRTLNALEVILHEEVEFRGWLELGHSYKDIMDVDYYRAHYSDVYPVAHSKAIKAQYGLVKHFAAEKGFADIPAYAYTLVSPLIELHGVPTAKLLRMLRYNPEITAEKVSPGDIETAAKVYETGGYTYKDRSKIIADAIAIIQEAQPAKK